MFHLCLLTIFILLSFFEVFAVPPEACFANFRSDDCGKPPTPVMYYWKPGSRCEVGLWRGCLPNINMFADEYECVSTCIFTARALPDDYHQPNENYIDLDMSTLDYDMYDNTGNTDITEPTTAGDLLNTTQTDTDKNKETGSTTPASQDKGTTSGAENVTQPGSNAGHTGSGAVTGSAGDNTNNSTGTGTGTGTKGHTEKIESSGHTSKTEGTSGTAASGATGGTTAGSGATGGATAESGTTSGATGGTTGGDVQSSTPAAA